MSPFIKVVILLSIVALNDACSKQKLESMGFNMDQRTCGSNCFDQGRSRTLRSAQKKLQDVLLEFDIRLTEDLANEIKDLSESEKEQFIQDIEKMNEAVKLEAKNISDNNDGSVQTPDEFLRAVSDRIASDFQSKKWFNRLRSIAGDQIAKLMDEITNKN